MGIQAKVKGVWQRLAGVEAAVGDATMGDRKTAVLPSILTGMKVSLSLGVALAVLAEMLAGENGLGFVILDAQRAFQIREMYAWIVILALFGVGLSLLFDKVERHAAPWRGR